MSVLFFIGLLFCSTMETLAVEAPHGPDPTACYLDATAARNKPLPKLGGVPFALRDEQALSFADRMDALEAAEPMPEAPQFLC